MTALDVFEYSGVTVRTVLLDGDAWFVAADVCKVLDHSNVGMAVAGLDEDEKGLSSIDTPGGAQNVTVISESGLYSLILRSRKAEAKAFKRWITHEVLPALRQTGSYSAPVAPELQIANALVLATQMIAAKDDRIAQLEPSASAWDELASAEGDYEVADAAKILARAGIETGRQRLFEQLAAMKWIYRGADRKWTAYQSPVDAGYLAEKPQFHYHPKSGEKILDAPQIRVTIKGLERLRVRLGKLELVPSPYQLAG